MVAKPGIELGSFRTMTGMPVRNWIMPLLKSSALRRFASGHDFSRAEKGFVSILLSRVYSATQNALRALRPVMLAFLALAAVSAAQQQPSTAGAQDEAAQPSGQATGQQPLDLQEAIAHDVLEPMRSGIQTQNVKQVLSVFDAESFPNFAQFRDQMRAFLDSYSAIQFRYKVLQATASEEGKAFVTCEADVDARPLDDGQVPPRRSTQLQLRLNQTSKGWRISGLTPNDFFAQ